LFFNIYFIYNNTFFCFIQGYALLKGKALLKPKTGGRVAEKLEPLIEMFRMNEKVLNYAEKLVDRFNKISFQGQGGSI